jgi:tetratricopeptide (TPR) repeat protein
MRCTGIGDKASISRSSLLVRGSQAAFGVLLTLSLPGMGLAQLKTSTPGKIVRTSAPPSAPPKTIAEFQRDPVRLIYEFSLNEKTRTLPFDLILSLRETLGPEAWEKLTPRQRSAIKPAFEKAVNGLWETWKADEPEPVRILRNETTPTRAVLTLLHGDELVRVTLASRDGAWFITEHELLDDALAEFRDALQAVLQPGAGRGQIYDAPLEEASRMIDRLIAAQGEKPELLLMKYRVLEHLRLERLTLTPETASTPNQIQALDQLLGKLTTRWPDFAPGLFARARALLYTDENDETVISPLSQDPETAIAELRRYAQLAPFDPRPHRDLGYAFQQMQKYAESETALKRAIELDPTYLEHYRALVMLYLFTGDEEKARTSLASMLRAAPSPDDAFEELSEEYTEEKPSADDGKALESLLLAFSNEIEKSYAGLELLTLAQAAQNRSADAVRTLRKAMAIETSAADYAFLSTLFREQRRLREALDAADEAIKLDDKLPDGWFERACSLAQLGRKREALAALKQILGLNSETFFDSDEPDLQPLASLPEYKAILEKMKNPAPTETEKKAKQKTLKP